MAEAVGVGEPGVPAVVISGDQGRRRAARATVTPSNQGAFCGIRSHSVWRCGQVTGAESIALLLLAAGAGEYLEPHHVFLARALVGCIPPGNDRGLGLHAAQWSGGWQLGKRSCC